MIAKDYLYQKTSLVNSYWTVFVSTCINVNTKEYFIINFYVSNQWEIIICLRYIFKQFVLDTWVKSWYGPVGHSYFTLFLVRSPWRSERIQKVIFWTQISLNNCMTKFLNSRSWISFLSKNVIYFFYQKTSYNVHASESFLKKSPSGRFVMKSNTFYNIFIPLIC